MHQREATPGVPSSTAEQPAKVEGANYQSRIAFTRSPEAACSVSAVYRAVTLRADVMIVMPVQFQGRTLFDGIPNTPREGL